MGRNGVFCGFLMILFLQVLGHAIICQTQCRLLYGFYLSQRSGSAVEFGVGNNDASLQEGQFSGPMVDVTIPFQRSNF